MRAHALRGLVLKATRRRSSSSEGLHVHARGPASREFVRKRERRQYERSGAGVDEERGRGHLVGLRAQEPPKLPAQSRS